MKNFLILLSILAVLFVLLLAGIRYANPPMPPWTTTPSLKPKASLPLSPTFKLLLKKGNPLRLKQAKTLSTFKAQIRKGEWFKTTKAVETWLASNQAFLQRFEKGLREKGCLPFNTSINPSPSDYKLLPILRGSFAIVIQSLLMLQKQQGSAGVQKLLWLSDRLRRYESGCRSNLVVSMILVASSTFLQQSFLFALNHPAVGTKEKLQLLRELKQWEVRPPAILDALREEAHTITTFMKTLKPTTAKASMKKGGKSKSGYSVRWPYYDREQSVQLVKELWRCRLRRMMEYPNKSMFKTCPIDDYFQQLSDRRGLWIYLRYNAVGKILIGIASPSFLKYVLKWHESRCFAGATRTLWLRSLTPQQRKRLPAQLTQEAKNPHTGKPFGSLRGKGNICATPKSWGINLQGLSKPVLPTRKE